MSEDEIVVTIASLVLGPGVETWWMTRVSRVVGTWPRPATWTNKLSAVTLIAAIVINRIIHEAAADDVRGVPQYEFMYFAMGWAWINVVSWFFRFGGISAWDDLVERRNDAVLPAWCGAILGVALCFAGGNIGNGPGWWVVVFSAGLATAALGVVWVVVAHYSGVVDAITIDRDPAAAWRFGGLLVACGVVFGYAVTGDWVSSGATIADFLARAWPILPVAVLAIGADRALRPTAARPRAPIIAGGVAPALLHIAIAITAVIYLIRSAS